MTEHGRGEVVCAVLSSEESEPAARLAARLAERLSLRLALVHVLVPLPPPSVATLEGPHPVAPLAVELVHPPEGHDPTPPRAASWEEELASSQPTRRATIVDLPAEALRRLSDAQDTRLLVIVDDGGGPLSSKFCGNAAREVIRDAGCPIVLVEPHSVPQYANIANILCGVHEDDATSDVAALAGALAERLGGRLRFVHVLPGAASGSAPQQVALDALDDDARQASQTVFDACAAALGGRAEADFVAVEGDAAEGLRAAARELQAGLIVIGQPQHGALASALLGSAAHDLLREGGAPVVIAPGTRGQEHVA